MITDPNQPAFPVPGYAITRGLNIREHFASMAMQALCSNERALNDAGRVTKGTEIKVNKLIASMSVDMADALITELSR